jgi:hypothetical protein
VLPITSRVPCYMLQHAAHYGENLTTEVTLQSGPLKKFFQFTAMLPPLVRDKNEREYMNPMDACMRACVHARDVRMCDSYDTFACVTLCDVCFRMLCALCMQAPMHAFTCVYIHVYARAS